MEKSMKDAQIAYVREALRQTGLDPTSLAKKAELSQTTLTRPLNNPEHEYGFSLQSLLAIQKVSGVPLPPALLGGNVVPIREKSPQAAAVGALDLPVRGQAAASNGGGIVLNSDLVETFVERPWFLLGRPKAYSLYVYDESMEPVFEHGHLLYVDPTRPVKPGDAVVIQTTSNMGYIKRLKRRTANQVICEQFNPPKDFVFPAGEVAEIHLVVAALRIST